MSLLRIPSIPGTILILFFIIILCRCASSKKTAYVFPQELQAMNRDSLVKICENGRTLFAEHCSGCHGIFSKGKDSVPDFTNAQIDLYGDKVLLRDPGNHESLINMSFADINAIQYFLRYREKSKK